MDGKDNDSNGESGDDDIAGNLPLFLHRYGTDEFKSGPETDQIGHRLIVNTYVHCNK